MGYTHYWTNVTDLPPLQPETIRRVKFVLAKYDDLLCGPDQGRPLVTAGRVAFNGRDEDGFEDFDWDRFETWDFCKTARMPYDNVVGMVLLILKEQYGAGMVITSDGDFDDWFPIVTGLRKCLQESSDGDTLVGTKATYGWVNEPHPGTNERELIDEQLRRLKLGMDRKAGRRTVDGVVGR